MTVKLVVGFVKGSFDRKRMSIGARIVKDWQPSKKAGSKRPARNSKGKGDCPARRT
jgi:hypothetical protein